MRDEIYDQVAKELKTGLVMEGLWLKSMIDTGGDSTKAKLKYVDNRVSYIVARKRVTSFKKFLMMTIFIPLFYFFGAFIFGLTYNLGISSYGFNVILTAILAISSQFMIFIKFRKKIFDNEPALVNINDLGSTT